MKVIVKGVPEAKAQLARLSDALAGKVLLRAVVAGALIVQNSAKRKAPYKTGNLRRSIHIEPRGVSRGAASVEVGTNVEYAHYLEFGTRYMAARPYLRPALDENRTAVQAAVTSALRSQIAAVALG